MIKVITFDKRFYDRDTIEVLSDKDKYSIALADRDNCSIINGNDYVNALNDSKPIEKYVYTYFVITDDGSCGEVGMYSNE